jgi:hypothetical protein
MTWAVEDRVKAARYSKGQCREILFRQGAHEKGLRCRPQPSVDLIIYPEE